MSCLRCRVLDSLDQEKRILSYELCIDKGGCSVLVGVMAYGATREVNYMKWGLSSRAKSDLGVSIRKGDKFVTRERLDTF